MSTSEVQRELAELRNEVAALSAARKQKETPTKRGNDDSPTDMGQGETEHVAKGQIEELTKLLQEEIRDMPVVTTLAVFALGILVGRYLR